MSPLQGDLWLYEVPDDKARPVLVISRDVAARARLVVAPVTSTVRGLASEITVGPGDGIDHDSVASLDNIFTTPKATLTRRLGGLGPESARERICAALAALADC